MRERRQLTRHVVRKSAKVLLGDQPSPIDCLVWDLTSKGACILLAPDLHVPDKFEISFDYFRSSHPCRVMWQTTDRVGVCFSAASL